MSFPDLLFRNFQVSPDLQFCEFQASLELHFRRSRVAHSSLPGIHTPKIPLLGIRMNWSQVGEMWGIWKKTFSRHFWRISLSGADHPERVYSTVDTPVGTLVDTITTRSPTEPYGTLPCYGARVLESRDVVESENQQRVIRPF
jgi:hypothetical protein